MMEEDFRDPVEILKDAIAYLERTHGEARARASLAWNIIDQRRDMMERRCIQDLMGPEAKAKQIACDCWRHPGNFEREFYAPKAPAFNAALQDLETDHKRALGLESEPEPPPLVLKPPPAISKHGKMAAAGEKEEE